MSANLNFSLSILNLKKQAIFYIVLERPDLFLASCQARASNELTAKRFPDWLRHSQEKRAVIWAGDDDQPWSERPGVQLRGVPTHCARSMDVINVARLYWLEEKNALTDAEEQAAARNFYVDFGQGVQQAPWSEGLHCLCKGSDLNHLASFLVGRLPSRANCEEPTARGVGNHSHCGMSSRLFQARLAPQSTATSSTRCSLLKRTL